MESSFANRSSVRDPLIGRVLHDRYRVEKRIGKGGMGIVYLAEHVLLRRKVALKTLSERAFASEELIARFHREATAAAAVGNEHVVGVTDMGQLDDGSFFVVLEYLDGVELGYAVAEDGPFSVPRAASVLMQLCEALTAVHAHGIVHRDLKPENLFLVDKHGARDFLKVLDFGVCKARDAERPNDKPLTHTGMSLGTPQFMAPEQIENSATVDARTDIYAAGAILYFALTGRPPYEEPTLPRLLLRICSEPPPPLRASRPELPAALEAVISRAMARAPEDRYPTSEAMRAALAPFARLDHLPATVRVSGVVPTTLSASLLGVLPKRRSVSRRALAMTLVVLAALALTLTIAFSTRLIAPSVATQREALTSPPEQAELVLDLTPALEPEPAAAPTGSALPAPASAPARAAKPRTRAIVAPAEAAAPEPPAPEATPAAVAEPAPPEPPVKPRSTLGLSQRELKDVFQ